MNQPQPPRDPHDDGEVPDREPHHVVVTAGHVDHGKSTLVRTLTGHDPDRLDEERRRGLTIDLGYAWVHLDDAVPGTRCTLAFVDVPGHRRFVDTMLAGAGPAPAALLVVAADDGWSAQTVEQTDALALLAVPIVAVAVTKADRVTTERSAAVVADVRARLGDDPQRPIVALDAGDPEAVAALGRALARRVTDRPSPPDIDRPRVWVDRAFTVPGAGTVVTGTSRDGTLEVGQPVRLLPGVLTSRIRGMQQLDRPVRSAGPGQRVALDLAGIDVAAVRRGDAIVAGGPWRVTEEADLWLRVLPDHEVGRRGAWRLHAGSATTAVSVLPLTGPLRDGASGVVRVRLERPLALVAGDRVVLRESGRRTTVAGGQVVDPAPPRARPRGRPARDARVAALRGVAEATDPSARLAALIEASGGVLDAEAALARAGMSPRRPPPDGVRHLGGSLVTRDRLAGWVADVEVALDGPRGAADIDMLARLEDAGAGPRLARSVLDMLVASGRIVRRDGTLRRSAAGPSEARPTGAESALLERLEEGGLRPPGLRDTARALGLDHRVVTRLVHAGEIVRCGDVAFSRAAVDRAITQLEALAADGPFTAAQAKTAWDTTRRFAIPLLERLDGLGVTRFDDGSRTMTGHRPDR